MKTSIFSVALALFAILPSCNKAEEPSIQGSAKSSLDKTEEQLQQLFNQQRTLLVQELHKQQYQATQNFRSLSSQEATTYVFNPEARENKIKAQPWTLQTKRFFLNLPQIFAGKIPLPSVHEVSLYSIPDGEKRLLVITLAFVNAASTLDTPMLRAAVDKQTSTREERIKAAKAQCERAYEEELAEITTEIIAGAAGGATSGGIMGSVAPGLGTVLGAFWGGVSGGAGAGVVQFIRARMHYSQCMKIAQNTSSQTIAPSHDEGQSTEGTPPLAQQDSTTTEGSLPPPTTTTPPPYAQAN